MLAKMYNDPEATSAWVKLVKERRKRIASNFDAEEPVPLSAVAAAAPEDIPRSQLADWDASARAWLRTANTIKAKEKRQLMSLLDKVAFR